MPDLNYLLKLTAQYNKHYINPHIYIGYKASDNKALFIKGPVYSGEVMFIDNSFPLKKSNRYTIQVDGVFKDESVHFDPTKSLIKFLNHKCTPKYLESDGNLLMPTTIIRTMKNYNGTYTIFCLANVNITALHNYENDTELNFDYATTESVLSSANGVECKCRSKQCRGKIKSFWDLDNEERVDLFKKGVLSDHLRAYLENNFKVQRVP